MIMSPYFSQLKDSYQSEIDDLRFDTEGRDVLSARLADRRRLFKEILPMMQDAPEMVAATFHGLSTVNDRALMEQFVLEGPGTLESWEVVSGNLTICGDQDPLVQLALSSAGGDEFLVTMACLQFIYDVGDDAPDSPVDEAGENSDEDGDEPEDDEHANNWLADQGFDRKTPS